ncbi:methylated-DNA--[protein]-cysteine S-methyltransferase [Microtetraspora fusca]|uniref:methylated-DNA--[protein]-cysteine S-methyltransferase n=1 Tax=Microtetraspora fusca TaxID=1997 RepID=UPI0008295F03|nr:methylated-DNA--[protein]-cysteine S-methyltransferase [Microtetraspora fusca]
MSARRYAPVVSTLGDVTLVADGGGLVGLYFPHHWHRPDASTFGEQVDASSDPLLAQAAHELDEYLAGRRREFAVQLAARGDEFQVRVWALLRQIPYGRTTTYGALAEQLGDRRLAQKVGQAVGRNPLCVFVACHRVIGANGALTGYAGGLERKRRLLELEEPEEARAGRLF